MERPEVPLEQAEELLQHHAEHASEPWIMGVALTAAVLAVLAAISALIAEHHANEAMIEQIKSSDQWSYYQAKSIKNNLLTTKIELLAALGKSAPTKDVSKLEQRQEDLEKIQAAAEEKERASEAHLRHHAILARAVTMFQVGIAIGAISVLTRRKPFWLLALGFGAVGAVMLAHGLLVV
jgi:hypothetical protein